MIFDYEFLRFIVIKTIVETLTGLIYLGLTIICMLILIQTIKDYIKNKKK